MTQVHCLQLEDLHSQISVANESTQDSGNDDLRRIKVSSYFTVNETNWRVLWGCYNGRDFTRRLERLFSFLLWVGASRSMVYRRAGCDESIL